MVGEVYLSGSAAVQPKGADELVSKRVLVFLAQGFEDAEAACLIDVLGWTNYRPTVASVAVDIAGFHNEVRGAFGTRYGVDVQVEDVDPQLYDALVIPGGFHNLGYDEAYDHRVVELARAFAERGCPIATLCIGVLPVADAGALEGGKATTYTFSSRHDNPGRLRDGGCEFVQEPLVEWKNVISCSGPVHSEAVARRLLEILVGEEAAVEVFRYRTGI